MNVLVWLIGDNQPISPDAIDSWLPVSQSL